MKKIKQLILIIGLNAVLLYIIANYIPELGFGVYASAHDIYITYLILGIGFRIVNSVIKKALTTLALPLKFLTLGLSTIVINIGIFYLFTYLINSFQIGVIIMIGTITQTFFLSLLIAVIYILVKKII